MATTPASPPNEAARRCWWRPLAFTAGLVPVFGALYAIGYAPYESTQIRADRRNLARMASGKGVVFGSSHGFNVLPEEAGFDGVNLSHAGQDVFEMVYMARAVKKRAPGLKTVVFTLSYFAFALDNAAFVSQGTQTRIGRRLVMYAAFPSLDFVPGDASSWVKGLLHPVVTRDHWKSVLWPSEPTEGDRPKEATNLLPEPKRDRGVPNQSEMESHAKRRCQQYSKLMRNMNANHEGLAEDAYEALRGASADLEKAGVRVVLLTVPYYQTYNDCFDQRRQSLTRRSGRRIASETGAEYIDAGRDPDFSGTRAYFRNSDHMNRDGKIEFSRWLGKRLAHTEKR